MKDFSADRVTTIGKIDDNLVSELDHLREKIKGDLYHDLPTRLLYATDASAYREIPLAVCYPAEENDIVNLVKFASHSGITIIPRAAGTSLAGQVVGKGLVVDISRYLTNVIQFKPELSQVILQPGVILDELNLKLKPQGLFFSPETSTSNRCMIGGMIGNNSSGLHSVVYGSVREHLHSVRIVLSDASIAEFGPLTKAGFEAKCKLKNFEGKLYRHIRDLLQQEDNREEILNQFPDPDVVRRNTGYALDELANTQFFDKNHGKHETFNFSRLIAGSEGTLGVITEATLNLDPLPPPVKALIPVHVDSVMEAIKGNVIALKHNPAAVELMDKKILDLTKDNISQNRNRFFLKGDPGAILIVEFQDDEVDNIHKRTSLMKSDFIENGIGSHFPIIIGDDIPRVWALRKAGLGVLSKMKGDAKPVSVIEDTSVTPYNLMSYIHEFNALLEEFDLECVYHAHISVGELHLRPVLNLKDERDVALFQTIARKTAVLVKKYRGSLSGEHGDGRLRSEFIPLMFGDKVYGLFRELKSVWDPNGLFNKGKIIDSPPMNAYLRHSTVKMVHGPDTIFDFSSEGGIIRHIEQCNGSGDCRKTELTGGTMCPSYMATRQESATTRARANLL
ncbi:MAG TPA: FAD-binding oxidoreductase, partial [Bacteroidales bacterium]|nr:FAD-binding oxidoreductase [Bacteroidales bacterium]